MEHDAKAYSAFNKPQYHSGSDFARSLQISEGDKVLDMGCGTGELTNFIASLVGPRGKVVGVDPDEERIKIAREKFKDVENIEFVVGDSSSKLPHDNQDYYDLHFSSNAFHWCVGEAKKKYIEKAFQCLKPKGRLAIRTALKQEHTRLWNKQIPGLDILTLAENKELFESSLFNIVKTEVQTISSHFSNLEEYKSWFRATTQRDWDEMNPESRNKAMKELTKTGADGRITLEIPNGTLRLVADKPELQISMEHDAKAYSELNKPQFDAGCDFARSLQISEGDKVLDMGCGTGEVTNFIASLVGPRGKVVGVDPDEERIKIAREKFKDVENLEFVVGDSSSKLPHDDQDYYDLHFSSNMFHWCVGEEKKQYIEKAFQCLKPQGRLALLTAVKQEHSEGSDQFSTLDLLSVAENIELFESSLFNIIKSEPTPILSRFSDFEKFKSWVRASTHHDWEEIHPETRDKTLKESITIATDGSLTVKIPNGSLRLVARKS